MDHANPLVASGQMAYMKGHFPFFGIKTVQRREIQKPFLTKDSLPDSKVIVDLIKELWSLPEREFHYFAQELLFKYHKNPDPDIIQLYEYMVVNKSWWDTVDFIATKLISSYFVRFPECRKEYIDKWLRSENLWLKRCALLFQLKYKKDTDTDLLKEAIVQLADSKEFFIRKAIGWVLREYARTDPDWVLDFTEKCPLSNLSTREALKHISV